MSDNHPKKDSIDLGLAIMRALYPNTPLNPLQQSYFCDCHPSLIYEIEKSAMRKLRGRLRCYPELLQELRLKP